MGQKRPLMTTTTTTRLVVGTVGEQPTNDRELSSFLSVHCMCHSDLTAKENKRDVDVDIGTDIRGSKFKCGMVGGIFGPK